MNGKEERKSGVLLFKIVFFFIIFFREVRILRSIYLYC